MLQELPEAVLRSHFTERPDKILQLNIDVSRKEFEIPSMEICVGPISAGAATISASVGL
jgi:hypothetical protein